MFKNYSKLLVVLIVMSLLITGCGSPAAKNPETTPAGSSGEKVAKDTLVIGVWEDLATMDPQSSNRASNWMVQRMIYDKLVHENSDGTVEPRLATSWEFIDDLTLEMKLRDDVYFTNGVQFTAEDVLYTLQRGKANPITASTFKYIESDSSVIVDDFTIQIKFNNPYAAIFNTLSGGRGGIEIGRASCRERV